MVEVFLFSFLVVVFVVVVVVGGGWHWSFCFCFLALLLFVWLLLLEVVVVVFLFLLFGAPVVVRGVVLLEMVVMTSFSFAVGVIIGDSVAVGGDKSGHSALVFGAVVVRAYLLLGKVGGLFFC